jgi:serine/threonine protein kinase
MADHIPSDKRYEIIRSFRSSQLGQVSYAKDTVDGSYVVVKEYAKESTKNGNHVKTGISVPEDFFNEVKQFVTNKLFIYNCFWFTQLDVHEWICYGAHDFAKIPPGDPLQAEWLKYIVKLLDHYQDDEKYYIVLEFPQQIELTNKSKFFLFDGGD